MQTNRVSKFFYRNFFSIALSFVVVACGGGGGGDGGGGAPAGASTAAPASPSVIAIPLVTKNPDSITVEEGGDATFSVSASDPGSLPLSYQWFRDDKEIPGENKASYVLRSPNLASDQSARFYVVVRNTLGGLVKSKLAVLTVAPKPPAGAVLAIESQPKTVFAQPGNDVSFSVVIKGGVGPFSYQWKKNGTSITGSNSPSITVRAASDISGSRYSVDISDARGQMVRSTTADLRVYDVYIAGYYTSNIQSRVGAAVFNRRFGMIWKNGVVHKVMNPLDTDVKSVTPTDISLLNDDVYASANISGVNYGEPGLWKVNRLIQLPTLGGSRGGVTTQIYLTASDVYVSGACYALLNKSCYWVNESVADKDSLTSRSTRMDGISYLNGSLHFLTNNTSDYGIGNDRKIYWVGNSSTDMDGQFLRKLRQFNGHTYTVGRSSSGKPAFWIDGKPGAIEVSQYAGELFDIYIEGDDIYVGGYSGSLYENVPDAVPHVATYWKKNGAVWTPTTLSGSEVNGLIAVNGEVFSVGTSSGGKPVYWRGAESVNLPVDNAKFGSTTGVALRLY